MMMMIIISGCKCVKGGSEKRWLVFFVYFLQCLRCNQQYFKVKILQQFQQSVDSKT